jgi:hypothetical protein
MKVSIDVKKLTDTQKRALVRQGLLHKSHIEPELNNVAIEAMQFFHRHFTNDELATMAGKTTAAWAWNIANDNTIKMYKLLIERLNITPSELLIMQSASKIMSNIQIRSLNK